MTNKERSDLESTISHALEEMKAEQGNQLDLKDVNLAALGEKFCSSTSNFSCVREILINHSIKASNC